MPVPSNDVGVINSAFISKRIMMCGIPYAYTAPVFEYEVFAAYAGNSSETSDTDEDGKPQHMERAAGVCVGEGFVRRPHLLKAEYTVLLLILGEVEG